MRRERVHRRRSTRRDNISSMMLRSTVLFSPSFIKMLYLYYYFFSTIYVFSLERLSLERESVVLILLASTRVVESGFHLFSICFYSTYATYVLGYVVYHLRNYWNVKVSLVCWRHRKVHVKPDTDEESSLAALQLLSIERIIFFLQVPSIAVLTHGWMKRNLNDDVGDTKGAQPSRRW